MSKARFQSPARPPVSYFLCLGTGSYLAARFRFSRRVRTSREGALEHRAKAHMLMEEAIAERAS